MAQASVRLSVALSLIRGRFSETVWFGRTEVRSTSRPGSTVPVCHHIYVVHPSLHNLHIDGDNFLNIILTSLPIP